MQALVLLDSMLSLSAAYGPPQRAWLQSATHVRMGVTHWLLGDPEAALEHLRRARNIAHEVGHEFNEIGALWSQGAVHALLGDTTTAIRSYERAVEICDQSVEPSVNQCNSVRAALENLRPGS